MSLELLLSVRRIKQGVSVVEEPVIKSDVICPVASFMPASPPGVFSAQELGSLLAETMGESEKKLWVMKLSYGIKHCLLCLSSDPLSSAESPDSRDGTRVKIRLARLRMDAEERETPTGRV